MKPAHQIIYTHGGGRLGNQVIRFLHWMAWIRSRDADVEVLNLAFWSHASQFARWRENPGCVFPIRSGRADWLARRFSGLPRRVRSALEVRNVVPRLAQAAGTVWPGWQTVALDIAKEESLDLENPAWEERIRGRRVTTCSGWKIANWRHVESQEKDLREFFRPAAEVQRTAREFVAEVRRGCDLVIGVLIRQSDYRVWNDGRFCFPTTQYADWMRQLRDLFPGKRIAMIVASEEWQDPAIFTGLPVRFATGARNAGGDPFESWVELSLCDLIVTPPSTFSATAAFLGDVAVWPLVAADQKLSEEQIIQDGLAGAARHPVFSLAVK